MVRTNTTVITRVRENPIRSLHSTNKLSLFSFSNMASQTFRL